LKIGAASLGLLGDLFWLIARVWLKARFCCAKSAKGGFAPLALQADGRDGIQQFCWRKACKVKICFARFAAQTLLASHFCLGNKSNQKFLTSARIVRKTGWIVDLTETPLLPS